MPLQNSWDQGYSLPTYPMRSYVEGLIFKLDSLETSKHRLAAYYQITCKSRQKQDIVGLKTHYVHEATHYGVQNM